MKILITIATVLLLAYPLAAQQRVLISPNNEAFAHGLTHHCLSRLGKTGSHSLPLASREKIGSNAVHGKK